MELKEIYNNLCAYDPRSDSYQDLKTCFGEDLKKPRDNCFCDNCFYGRDKLAIEILKAKGKAIKSDFKIE